MMKTFRVTFQVRSATASTFDADTIFGHLCWALRYLDGEEALQQFLQRYRAGQPPLVLSEGFPGNLVPRPLIMPTQQESQHASLKDKMEAFDRGREARKVSFLKLDEFNALIQGRYIQPTKENKPEAQTRVVLKNQIDRLTNTTGESGQLFEFEETYWSHCEGDEKFPIPVSIYVKVEEGFEEKAKRLFDFVAREGYGKRKSVGYGAIDSFSFEAFNGFTPPSSTNGFITLSSFVPAKGDPTEGYWKVRIKYGKLGEEYASDEDPFKKPVVMLQTGSAFYDSSPRKYYGRMVENVAARRGVVQYGFAFPVAARLVPPE